MKGLPMLHKLWLGFTLRCPNCGKGKLSDNFFSMRRECDVCHVVFERKSGESAGASAIWMATLPFFALVLFFIIYFTNPEMNIWLAGGIPMLLMLFIGIFFYRNVRGLWIATTYLSGGVYADEDKKQ
jgi:uncharacterized protein (DUF983 family)